MLRTLTFFSHFLMYFCIISWDCTFCADTIITALESKKRQNITNSYIQGKAYRGIESASLPVRVEDFVFFTPSHVSI